jgi:hypothetical protein
MALRIDCDSCLVRGLACHDCVVTVLLGPPPESGFDDDDQRALAALADSGLVPHLRMVDPVAVRDPQVEGDSGDHPDSAAV